MTGVACGSTPRTWVPAFAGKTEVVGWPRIGDVKSSAACPARMPAGTVTVSGAGSAARRGR